MAKEKKKPGSTDRVYAGLRETGEMFEWLEKAYQEHSSQLYLLKADTTYDAFHSDPRFQGLLRRLTLPA